MPSSTTPTFWTKRRRIPRHLLAAVFLLLFLIVIALWATVFNLGYAAWLPIAGRNFQLSAEHHGIAFSIEWDFWFAPTTPGFTKAYWNPDNPLRPFPDHTIDWQCAGFALCYESVAGPYAPFFKLTLPYWFLALTTALPAFRLFRRKRPLPPNTCPTCGYDLRATPHRCPECGTIIPQSTDSQTS